MLTVDEMQLQELLDQTFGYAAGAAIGKLIAANATAAAPMGLPCRIGDKVYRICGSRRVRYVGERRVESIEVCADGIVIHSTGDDYLGETVFLKKEEADAALEKRTKV